jgi:hypothetical protein
MYSIPSTRASAINRSDRASELIHCAQTLAGPASSPIPSRYTKYNGQVKCIDWTYETKLHPPVPVIPVGPSSRVARITRARHRGYKTAQSGIPIPSRGDGDGDARKHKRKLSFPFSFGKLAKNTHESTSAAHHSCTGIIFGSSSHSQGS